MEKQADDRSGNTDQMNCLSSKGYEKLSGKKSVKSVSHTSEIANLISKLNFYKLIPYPMDKCYSGRRRPARQTSEKDVLCFHRLAGP